MPLPPSCSDMIALFRRGPNPFVAELERRVVQGTLAPWGVQLSAGFSRERALTSYARLAKQYATVLAGLDPSILATTLRTRGSHVFYQVRIGAPDPRWGGRIVRPHSQGRRAVSCPA